MSRRWHRAPAVRFALLGGMLFGAERVWQALRPDDGPPAAPAVEQARRVREDLERRWG